MTDRELVTDPGTDLASSHAEESADEARTHNEQDAEGEQSKSKLFGGKGPAEAARLRWERERIRKADETQQAAHEAAGISVIVRVSVPVGAIIRKLSAQAQKGDVSAARELRAYLSEANVETETDLSALDRRTLQAMKARLLQEIADEEQLEAIEMVEVVRLDDAATEEGATPASGTPGV